MSDFDAFSRTIATKLSRRGVFKLAGTAAATAVASQMRQGPFGVTMAGADANRRIAATASASKSTCDTDDLSSIFFKCLDNFTHCAQSLEDPPGVLTCVDTVPNAAEGCRKGTYATHCSCPSGTEFCYRYCCGAGEYCPPNGTKCVPTVCPPCTKREATGACSSGCGNGEICDNGKCRCGKKACSSNTEICVDNQCQCAEGEVRNSQGQCECSGGESCSEYQVCGYGVCYRKCEQCAPEDKILCWCSNGGQDYGQGYCPGREVCHGDIGVPGANPPPCSGPFIEPRVGCPPGPSIAVTRA